MKSIFSDKNEKPSINELESALGATFNHWQELERFTKGLYPQAIDAWYFSGEKYGWGFRISDKKRVLVYLLPRDKFFKVAFVFGQKATDAIMKSDMAESIKSELSGAKVYAEGRGIRIDVKDSSLLADIKQLIEIKISN